MLSNNLSPSTALPTLSSIGLRNAVLATLSDELYQTLRPRLVRVRLIPGQVLVETQEPAQHVFFLLSGLVCLMANEGTVTPELQLAMIGREGTVGLMELVTGSDTAFAYAAVQVGGTALRISVPEFRQVWERSTELREVGQRSVHHLIQQLMQGAASNARETLGQRCVRWLAMASDRLGMDEVQITHDALAAMLCVRRSGVTVATAALQDKGLIQTGRGRIRIVDPVGLRKLAGDMLPPLGWIGSPGDDPAADAGDSDHATA